MTLTPLEQEHAYIDRIVSLLYHNDRPGAMEVWADMVRTQWTGDYRWSFVQRLVETAIDLVEAHDGSAIAT